MPRAQREVSEGDVYHVFARGIGRQLIFEDDMDRKRFLKTMGELLHDCNGRLLAWVLMGNHFHLLLGMPLDDLSDFMRDLLRTYAQYFNKRHGREGHLFQGRFGSQPITSDEQLMACVRYIHRNPFEGGICKTLDYKWSSYRGYLQGAAVTSTDFMLELFDGTSSFVEFHKAWDDNRFEFNDVDEPACGEAKGLTDSQANETAVSLLGANWREKLPGLSKTERNAQLRQLKENGLSVRQIERFTGLGRNIIQRA